MKSIIAFSTLFLMLSGNAYCETPEPEKCPAVAELAKVGFDVVKATGATEWEVIIRKNQFNTNEEWSFGLMRIKAVSEREARAKAADSFNSMIIFDGPSQSSRDNNEWTCLYGSQVDHTIGGAVTPPRDWEFTYRNLAK
jgi:hypothetical protein